MITMGRCFRKFPQDTTVMDSKCGCVRWLGPCWLEQVRNQVKTESDYQPVCLICKNNFNIAPANWSPGNRERPMVAAHFAFSHIKKRELSRDVVERERASPVLPQQSPLVLSLRSTLHARQEMSDRASPWLPVIVDIAVCSQTLQRPEFRT